MVVKIYISGISGNKEVKKRQQRVLMILDSKSIKYELIDITEPGRESDKEYMQSNSKSNGGTVSDPNPRSPLPPQMFNDEEYCGDYDQFDLANEVDTLEQFLKLEVPTEVPLQTETEKEKAVNGDVEIDNKESNGETQATSTEDKPTDKGEIAVKESTPSKEESPAKEGTPLREATRVDDAKDTVTDALAKDVDDAKDTVTDALAKDVDDAKDTVTDALAKDVDDAKDTVTDALAKDVDDAKDTVTDALAKGDSKEATPERQKSVDKEATSVKAASPVKELESEKSKENTPEKESVNENGTVSSRETSQEKDEIDETTVERKKDPSESLIQSEQTAAAE